MAMDGVRAIAQSTEALGRIMQVASAKSQDMAKKLMIMSVEMNVGKELGKGQNVDLSV